MTRGKKAIIHGIAYAIIVLMLTLAIPKIYF